MARTDDAVIDELLELGVTIEEPETSKEESFARALEAFAHFVLVEQPDKTLALLEQQIDSSSSLVGELSGGNSAHSIYRLSIPQHDEAYHATATTNSNKGAAELLLDAFAEKYPNSSLTVHKLDQYMLNMCNRRSRRRQECSNDLIDDPTYSRLGNLMFILSLGPVHGQVRHIDHMNPNLQICLYMSPRCPSTIVYAMNNPVIASSLDLRNHWESLFLPRIVAEILKTMGDVPLSTKAYAKYFGWVSLNDQLRNFGRLYQSVSHALQNSRSVLQERH